MWHCPHSPTTFTAAHTPPFSGSLSRTTRVSRYQKGKPNLDFTEARDSEWQWYQLGHMQVCTTLQTDNYASTPPLSFLQAGCPSCRPTNSVKALRHHSTIHCSNRSISPACRAHSSSVWQLDGTDRHTDARQLHRPCSAYCMGGASRTEYYVLN